MTLSQTSTNADSNAASTAAPVVIDMSGVSVFYSGTKAVDGATLQIREGEIVAFIGPSGCGKSSLLRSINRMNDRVDGARVTGTVRYRDIDVYGPHSHPVELRRRIGMVFQKPNPFPKSIYANVASGPRLAGITKRGVLDEIVENALRQSALWDEVKDRLRAPAFGLSGGQQQRLCIARSIAIEPDVLLMDEPCSALDPIATARIEDLMHDLKTRFSIAVVTHNMSQASRVSDRTAFFTTDLDEQTGNHCGSLVEFNTTEHIFRNPSDPRTEHYVSGRFG